MPYARWLMTQHLGRKLDRSEQVDHIDEDPMNDSIDNLQILSQKENLEKHAKLRRFTEMAFFTCPICGTWSSKKARHVRHNRNLGNAGPYCGKSCAGKASHMDMPPPMPDLTYELV